MKRIIAAGTAMILLIMVVAPSFATAATTQVITLTFNRQQWITGYTQATYYVSSAATNVVIGSFNFLLSNPGYPAFAYLKVSFSANVSGNLKVQVTNESFTFSFSGTSAEYYIPLKPHPVSSIPVEVTILNQNASAIDSVSEVKILVTDSGAFSYYTRVLPTTIPAGNGGGLALSLNRAQINLVNPMNLTGGAIGMVYWWDGKAENITSWLEINGTGHLIVHFGNVEYASPFHLNNTWNDIYIGWEPGLLYLGAGSTVVSFPSFNWTVPVKQFGNANQTTAALIDTITICNSFVTADELAKLLGTTSYHIYYYDHDIKIAPTGGGQLGTITVAFLSSNLSTVASSELSPTQMAITAPKNATYVVLTAGGVSRMYQLENTSITLAFPGDQAAVLVAKISVTPGSWSTVTVKTTDGKIAWSGPLQDDAFDFAAIQGQTYLITFHSDGASVTRMATITGDTVFYVARASPIVKPPLSITAYYKDGNVEIEYYDANNATSLLNISIIIYNNFAPSVKYTHSEYGPFGYYRFVIPANTSADYAKIFINAKVNGTWQSFEKTVIINQVGGKSPFPSNLIPTAFVVLGAAIVPFFLGRGTEPWLMLIGGAVGLTFAMLMSWIPATPVIKMLTAALTVLGVVAMLGRRW